jgi:hypothetical protein
LHGSRHIERESCLDDASATEAALHDTPITSAHGGRRLPRSTAGEMRSGT